MASGGNTSSGSEGVPSGAEAAIRPPDVKLMEANVEISIIEDGTTKAR